MPGLHPEKGMERLKRWECRKDDQRPHLLALFPRRAQRTLPSGRKALVSRALACLGGPSSAGKNDGGCCHGKGRSSVTGDDEVLALPTWDHLTIRSRKAQLPQRPARSQWQPGCADLRTRNDLTQWLISHTFLWGEMARQSARVLLDIFKNL